MEPRSCRLHLPASSPAACRRASATDRSGTAPCPLSQRERRTTAGREGKVDSFSCRWCGPGFLTLKGRLFYRTKGQTMQMLRSRSPRWSQPLPIRRPPLAILLQSCRFPVYARRRLSVEVPLRHGARRLTCPGQGCGHGSVLDPPLCFLRTSDVSSSPSVYPRAKWLSRPGQTLRVQVPSVRPNCGHFLARSVSRKVALFNRQAKVTAMCCLRV